jgi:alpha-N-arabinofuranosidase
VPYLDCSAAYDNGVAVVNVVNRHREEAIQAEFEFEDKKLSGVMEIQEVNGPDIKAGNDFGSTQVSAVSRSVSPGGGQFAYNFPPHSYTMLKVRLV